MRHQRLPVSPSPVTILTTPFGNPTSWHNSANASAVSGVNSAGFRTTVLPGGKRGRDLPRHHQQRKIPRNNLPNNSAGAISGELVFQQLRPPRVIIKVPRHQRYVYIAAFADRLAVVQAFPAPRDAANASAPAVPAHIDTAPVCAVLAPAISATRRARLSLRRPYRRQFPARPSAITSPVEGSEVSKNWPAAGACHSPSNEMAEPARRGDQASPEIPLRLRGRARKPWLHKFQECPRVSSQTIG